MRMETTSDTIRIKAIFKARRTRVIIKADEVVSEETSRVVGTTREAGMVVSSGASAVEGGSRRRIWIMYHGKGMCTIT